MQGTSTISGDLNHASLFRSSLQVSCRKSKSLTCSKMIFSFLNKLFRITQIGTSNKSKIRVSQVEVRNRKRRTRSGNLGGVKTFVGHM